MFFETNLIDVSLCLKNGWNIHTLANRNKLKTYVEEFLRFK